MALAKEKIQTIVEGEWKKTKRVKTRQSMARWLSIESHVSDYKTDKEMPPGFDSKQDSVTKTTVKEAIVSQPTSLHEISNCESAIATPSIPIKLEAHPIEVINGKANLNLEFQEENKVVEKPKMK